MDMHTGSHKFELWLDGTTDLAVVERLKSMSRLFLGYF